ncbi:MAG: hypothetical protein KC646_08815 [Candidatus Cloacimonetes bacterium]|nr:hypothetical protein [Candidatus Cloacimonadota bacterium]
MKICIITLEQTNRNYSLSGGALRVTGLKYLLQSMGHEVVVLQKEGPQDLNEDTYSFQMTEAKSDGLLHTDISDKILEISPDQVIVEQWGLLEWFETEVPVIVDLHGSLIWENYYKGYRDEQQTRAKLICLAKADAVIVPGERQYYYFLAWSQMAGLKELDQRLRIVPLLLDESFYEHKVNKESSTIVMGGATWPWVKQLPEEKLQRYLEKENLTVLSKFYQPQDTSIHHNDDGAIVKTGEAHNTLIKQYCQSLAAFDLYEINMERKLAVTTRSVEYLYCGLPIIYSKGLELSDIVENNGLGILIDQPSELFKLTKLKSKLQECKRNVFQFNLKHYFFDKAQESLDCILNLTKKKNTLSPITNIEIERRLYRKRVGELESSGPKQGGLSEDSFYKDLWLKDMETIYKRNLK